MRSLETLAWLKFQSNQLYYDVIDQPLDGDTGQLKCALNLHLLFTKKYKVGITYGIFLCSALVLMMLTKFVPNCTIRRCSYSINLFIHDAKFAPNSVQICVKQKHCRKLVQIRYHKGD